MKTSELTGAALDWAVAKCEGHTTVFNHQYTEDKKFDGWWQLGPNHWQPLRTYSTDWTHGGPIIERECFARIVTNVSGGFTVSTKVKEEDGDGEEFLRWVHGSGPTPLIAAMRCYVASKLGDEVEVPNELA
jgi:hypothetical protein